MDGSCRLHPAGRKKMNPLDKQIFIKPFRKQLLSSMPEDRVNSIWEEAGNEYARILREHPEIKDHKGSMVLPCVAVYRALEAAGMDAEKLLCKYGKQLGIKLAGAVHAITSIPGVDKLIWKNAGKLADRNSSESKGYRRRLVSDPPHMYGVDILSCPYHELAKQLGTKKAVLCICSMDKEYAKGFRHIRYDRNSALPEGADCCEYRLRYDKTKN